MKQAKKLLALVMVLAMVMSLGITAFAAAGDSVTSTITVPDDDGHTYEAFQVLTATLTEDEEGKAIFSDVSWGKNAKAGVGSVEDFMDSIKDLGEKALRDAVEAVVNLNTDPAYTLTQGTTTDVEPGYYIIRDTGVVGEDYTRTRYIVQVAGPLTITRKIDQPSSEKKVKDTNDSTGETSEWQDSADHDIGDEVSFKLTATVAADMADYKGPYALTFHDVQSAGLTFQLETVKAYVGNSETPINPSLYTVTTNGEDGCTFEVHFANVKDIEGVAGGTVIRVEYTSVLNADAVIGSVGNPNKMHITYSNNPNDEQGGENGKTPDDTVIVFTFKTVVNKVDQDEKELAGAEFTLYKFNKNTNKYEEVEVITSTEEKPLTSFEFKGLDDGEYKLEETVTPPGYNTIDPIEFKITAEHEIESAYPELTSLNGEKVSGEITLVRDNANEDALTAKIQNNKGTVLPSTGGIGTTIFYVVGSMMMLAAAVLLITRKKMSAYQD